jgi:hypothetical protein
MKKQDHQIEEIPIGDLIPYANNSRTHSAEQIAQIAASMVEFGWTNPVLIDAHGTIVAGHGRVLAARKLKMEMIPCIRLGHLTPSQVRAYVIADNKLAMNAGWDEKMLAAELATLREDGFEMDLVGFSGDELTDLIGSLNGEAEDTYSTKIKGLIYEITGEKPTLNQMVETSKASNLISEIESSDIDPEAKSLLLAAANRHVVFNYGSIAEYYAHAPTEVQKLMERSALVVVDMDSAIENGYVEMTKTIEEIQKRARNK